MTTLAAIANMIDIGVERLGRLLAWLALVMASIVASVVLLRYCFAIGSIALQESIGYLHATLFMLGIGYTYKHNGHVRVDIFYRDFAPKRRALVDLFGTLLFLLPVALLIFLSSYDYVITSWRIGETSEESSGIPFVYGLKTLLLIMPVLLILQGISHALRQIVRLWEPQETRQL